MNTRSKGRRNEKRAKDILESLGFQVQMAPMPHKWSTQNDLFGLWDLMGVKTDAIRFVQVKTNHKPTKAYIASLKSFPCPALCSKELWIFKDRVKEPVIYIL